MKKMILPAILFFSVALSSFAESGDLPESLEVPPAPVVSGLTAVSTGTTVTLGWIPAPDIEGENIILRANRPITSANYAAAEKRGSVPANANTFTDTIEESSDFFYAILTRDADGTYYDFFLPASNSLLVPVRAVTGIQSEEAVLSAFDAMTKNDAVIVTWNASIKNKNVVLYRSTSPFTGMTSLVPAVVVSAFRDDGAPYVDYPVPGVPYYYAILDEDAIRSGTARFEEGVNTNRIPVEIPSIYEKIKRAKLPVVRSMPLPWLNPSSEVERAPVVFSAKTEAKIGALLEKGNVRERTALKPYVFLSDSDASATGEEFALKGILEGNFRNGALDGAIADFNEFLAIRRTDDTTARTRFYLGEAWYFKGEYSKALLEFLLSEDRYYNQSREWIEYILEKMTR